MSGAHLSESSTVKRLNCRGSSVDVWWMIYNRECYLTKNQDNNSERRISLGTIRVFPGSIRSTTDFSYGETGSR